MLISVVVCTYNPDDSMLVRALDAILAQDLDPQTWELLVVDNNSSTAVSSRQFIRDRGIRVEFESRQGLSAAREFGTRNTRGEVIVFVDDDNVLSPDYLRHVVDIFSDTRVGIVSGAIEPEYEMQPPGWFSDFEEMLAIRRPPTAATYLTNIPSFNQYFPIGAGMAVRRELVNAYYQSLAAGSTYIPGRVGSDLSSAEDVDLDFFAISQGYLVGTAGSLNLRHVIPVERTTADYLSRLTVAATTSAADVNRKWAATFGGHVIDSFAISRRRLFVKYLVATCLSWDPRFKVRRHSVRALLDVWRNAPNAPSQQRGSGRETPSIRGVIRR